MRDAEGRNRGVVVGVRDGWWMRETGPSLRSSLGNALRAAIFCHGYPSYVRVKKL